MGYIVQEPLNGARYIDPRGIGHMIARTHWTQLDDCHFGIPANTVDWDGCPLSVKSHLIVEYNMGYIVDGYQPKKKKEKTHWFETPDAACEWSIKSVMWIGYPTACIWWIVPSLIASQAHWFLYIVAFAVAFPVALLGSVFAGGILGLLITFSAESIYSRFEWRRSKKQAKIDDFNNFIKGCRK